MFRAAERVGICFERPIMAAEGSMRQSAPAMDGVSWGLLALLSLLWGDQSSPAAQRRDWGKRTRSPLRHPGLDPGSSLDLDDTVQK